MKLIKYFNIQLLSAVVVLHIASSNVALLAAEEQPISNQPVSAILREVQSINNKIPKRRNNKFTALVTTIALLETAYIVYTENPYNVTSRIKNQFDTWYKEITTQSGKDNKATSTPKKDEGSDSGNNNNDSKE